MCGFVGFIDFSRQGSTDDLHHLVATMNDRLTHRGPDDSGVWVGKEEGVALGHRRLSIIDLSAEGRQPMFSAGGRFVIVFNGEIYNYESIRQKLENELGIIAWRGHSDTEVMLAAVRHWGLERAVTHFVGMFAFALWDQQERTLHLVRDRMGEKPLYYGWVQGAFLFGSELKPFRVHPRWKGDICRDALSLFMQYNYVPAPHTIYQGFFKLPPGCIVSLKPENFPGNCHVPQRIPLPARQYWSAKEVSERGDAQPFQGSVIEAIQDLEELIKGSVRQQMLADVPLGAFLSGGIDSSTVVAIMQSLSTQPVQTFTIGIKDSLLDEASQARAVARHLGTNHTEMYIDANDALATIPRLSSLYDEPFADSSQIPTFLVSRLARKHVTVSLSGDGGDELFGGYNTYFMVMQIWKTLGWLPQWGRTALARILAHTPAAFLDRGFGWLGPFIIKHGHSGKLSEKLIKLSEILGAKSPDLLYSGLISNWKNPAALVLGSHEIQTVFTDQRQQANLTDLLQRLMFFDQVTYLPGDILVKLDRAAMGVSLETRVPLLDHRIVEFSWQLPLSMKIRAGVGKWLLRQVLYQYVPDTLFKGPKKGFEIPIGSWLRGPLREWAEPLLEEKRLRQEGFFNPSPIREKWSEHLDGFSRQNSLWNVLTFQSWLEKNQGHE